ncbi:MAG TPA: hypothetical protein VGI39_07775 [Polyangiaceae bacterium]|jgi:tetratricopeptide (TPR) repeat protein
MNHAFFRSAFRFTVALTPLAAAGCAGAQSRGATPHGEGAGWTEVTTEHFVLKTDLGVGDAQDAALKLEGMFSALAELGFASADKPSMRIDVVYFRRHEDYAALRPDVTSGQFRAGGFHDLERRPTAVLGGDFVESTRRVLQHELTHLFVHYYYPRAPVWLNEGFARYFETLALDDGTAILGRAPKEARFWKGPWRVTAEKSWSTVALIPMEEAPSIGALRAMNGDFYVDLNADTRSAHGRDTMRTMASHYQGAWCLVHLLLEDQSYAHAFADYLGRIHAGEGEGSAWKATIGALPADKLEADYRAALVPKEVTTLRTHFTPPAPAAAPAVRAVGDREVRTLWARLRDWQNPEAHAAAAAVLDDANATGLTAEEASARAMWDLLANRRDDAEEILRETLREAPPHEGQVWNALGWTLLHEVAESVRGRKVGPVNWKAKLDEVAAQLRPIAESAPELDLLARLSAIQGSTEDALALEKRALAKDPSCRECLIFSADLLAKTKHYREAFDAETLALDPDADLAPAFAEQLEQWRRLAASESATPAATTALVAVPHADAVLGAMRSRFHACFADGGAAGSVEFAVKVNAKGAVTGAEPRSGATFPPKVVDCLAGVLKAGHFPAPGADTTLSVPIQVKGK